MRRLVLFMPMTADEADSATAWGRALESDGLRVEYRPSPTPMRVLLFDAVTRMGKGREAMPRRVRARVIKDPIAPAVASLRSAMATGDVVFNVFTAHPTDNSAAYPGTDAVFTAAMPEGAAVAWCARVTSGVAPGVAGNCLLLGDSRNYGERAVRNSARLLFFKRPPRRSELMEHERRVIAFARKRLAEVS